MTPCKYATGEIDFIQRLKGLRTTLKLHIIDSRNKGINSIVIIRFSALIIFSGMIANNQIKSCQDVEKQGLLFTAFAPLVYDCKFFKS